MFFLKIAILIGYHKQIPHTKGLMTTETKASFNPIQYIVSDLAGYLLTIGPTITGICSVVFTCREIYDRLGLILAVSILPMIYTVAFIFTVFVFRLALPRLRPGKYPIGFNRDFLAWSMHMGLNRSIEILGFRNFIFNFNSTKFLYWRALGAKVSYSITSSLSADLCDHQLLEIGEHCKITSDVLISAHTFFNEQLILEPVRLHRNVYIGMNTTVFSGCEIGDDCYVGSHNLLFRNNLAPKTTVKNYEWQQGSPKDVRKS